MSDDHAHAGDRISDGRLWATAFLNLAITVAEVVGGLLSGSLALLSDAAHNLSDVAAIVLALLARRFGRRPSTLRYTYGFRRAEVLAALINAATLIVITALIAREAVVRLLHPEPVAQGIMLAVASVAFVANVASVLLLFRHDRGDVNVRSAFLHLAQDAFASFAVVVAALLAHTAVGPYVDPAAAFLVGIVVFRSALSLVWETVTTLMEAVPEDVDIAVLAREVAAAFPGLEIHHVHVWQNGPSQRLFTGHVSLETNLDAESIERLFTDIKTHLHERWEVTHATLEPEVAGCGQADLLGRWPGVKDADAQRREPEAGGRSGK